jgi:hexosaminidase
MWGEGVDDTNIIARIFPFASAVAERLWSPASMKLASYDVGDRLAAHRCLLNRRGIGAAPIHGGAPCGKKAN